MSQRGLSLESCVVELEARLTVKQWNSAKGLRSGKTNVREHQKFNLEAPLMASRVGFLGSEHFIVFTNEYPNQAWILLHNGVLTLFVHLLDLCS